MLQAFQEECRTQGKQTIGIRRPRLWLWVLSDLARSAPVEHWMEWRQRVTQQRETMLTRMAAAALIMPVLFVSLVVAGFVVGNPDLVSIMTVGRENPIGRFLMEAIVVLGPAAALGLSLLSLVRVQIMPEASSILTITLRRANLLQYAVLALGLALAVLFGVYFVLENAECLLGYKTSC
jgi:hypothetical protein